MVYRGRVANGVIRLEGSVVLPEGAEVRVELATGPKDEDFRASIEQELDWLASLPANWDREGAPRIDPAIIRAAHRCIAGCRPTLRRFPRWFRRRQVACNSSGTPAADRSNWNSRPLDDPLPQVGPERRS